MRSSHLATFVILAIAAFGCAAIVATTTPEADLDLINRLDTLVQHRFEDPAPANLGMSRVARPQSFGVHFAPARTYTTDFQPENPAEQSAIASLEERGDQVGLYLYGSAIADAPPSAMNYRALKGPAALTRGTPRPNWYPSQPQTAVVNPDALPDWNAIYPLASRAMRSFADGGRGFETEFNGWTIAARPVVASQERCVSCHNNTIYHPTRTVKINESIGGVIYAFRHPPT